jgi:DNA-binding MarR family transcriptional regulator
VTTRVPAPSGVETALADELFAAIGVFRRTARRAAGRPWSVDDLSTAQAELLRLIRRQPAISVADAAAELRLAPNTVSTLVRQLVDRGQLTRASDPDDRRVARLDLTPPARQRVERWRDQRSELAADAISRLSPDDRAALARAVPILGALAMEMGSQ